MINCDCGDYLHTNSTVPTHCNDVGDSLLYCHLNDKQTTKKIINFCRKPFLIRDHSNIT